MNIVCLATYVSESEFSKNSLFSKTMPQGYLFASNLIRCFETIDGAHVSTYGIAPYPSTFPHQGAPLLGKAISAESNIINVSFLNIFGLKSLSTYRSLKKNRKIIESKLGPQTLVVATESFTPYVRFAIYLKRKYGCKALLVTQDLPEFMSLRRGRPIYRALKRLDTRAFYKTAKQFDGYLPITEGIIQKIAPQHEKYLVLNGLVRPEDIAPVFATPNPNTFLFAGSLHFAYGIQELLDAFILVQQQIPNAKLVICGFGEASEQIVKAAKSNTGLVFRGQLKRDEVISLERASSVLVNPRVNNEFTNYSFPSKTLEYMATGRPTVTHRLHGIPKEYYEYLIAPEAETPQSLGKAMVKAAQLSYEEQRKLFEAQRKFLLKNNGIESFASALKQYLENDL